MIRKLTCLISEMVKRLFTFTEAYLKLIFFLNQFSDCSYHYLCAWVHLPILFIRLLNNSIRFPISILFLHVRDYYRYRRFQHDSFKVNYYLFEKNCRKFVLGTWYFLLNYIHRLDVSDYLS